MPEVETHRRSSTNGVLRFVVKLALTVGAAYLLLAHRVTDAEGQRVTTFAAIRAFLPQVDAVTFVRWVFLATAVKLVGILASMLRWSLLLRGQGIALPFRHVFGSFLIGRFLGTFLPSTIGLDGYKLYDAARFSGRSVEASGATLVEKVIGVTGIFATYLVALPFGVSIFGDRAGDVVALTVPLALLPLAGCFAIFAWPGPRGVAWLTRRVPAGPLAGFLRRLGAAVAAYGGKAGVIGAAAGLSFVVHFTTAAMYFFTALAIGVTTSQVSFWQVTFASSIQILATVLSPFTIAGEGIREIAQYYLLSHLMGPAESIVSAALGFWAAEALTLVGGAIWWWRKSDYTPAYCRVDGRQVDYAAAAVAARDLGVDLATADRTGVEVEPLARRALRGIPLGFFGGLLAALLLGVGEAAVTTILSGPGDDMQVLWYAVVLYGAVLAPVGAGMGAVCAAFPLSARLVARWTPVVTFGATFFPLGLAVSLFRLQRDLYAEHRPPFALMLLALLGVCLVTVLVASAQWRAGAAATSGRGSRPLRRAAAMLGVWIAAAGIGALAGTSLGPDVPASRATRSQVPVGLASRPNLVLVVVDTLRADHLGAYGDRRQLSPNVDAFARDATVLPATGQSSWTKPSIATILTSLYASTHTAMSKAAILPDSVVTLPEVLRDAGYTTAGFVSNINLAPSFNFQQGFEEYTYLAPDYLFGARESSSKLVLYSILRKVWLTVNKTRRANQYYQDSGAVNEQVIPWIESHASDRFFLFVHYMDPHDPYFRHPYDGHAVARVENPNPPAALAADMRDLYAGEVRHVDGSFGELVKALRRLGLYDDTAIVFTADHGEEFQEHGGWWHGTTLYDEQIAVPLIVKLPGARAAAPAPPEGRARLLDVAPTIAALGGASVPATWQGADLRNGIPADRPVFAEEDHESNVLSAVQIGALKLIKANSGNPRGLAPLELYDHAGDPGERRNLVADRPEELALLESPLLAFEKSEQEGRAAGAAETEMDETTRERLRALGYVQ